MKNFFDREERAVGFLLVGDRTTVHLNDGSLVAEVVLSALFNGDGRFLGWFAPTGIFDRGGRRVLTLKASRESKKSGMRFSQDFAPATRSSIRMRQTIPVMPDLLDDWSPISAAVLFSTPKSQHGASGRHSATG